MKIIDLIEFLIEPDKLPDLYAQYQFNEKSEAILIYLKEDLSIVSDVYLFEIEETEDDILYEKDNVKYIQLFPVDYAIELIESDLNLKNKRYSKEEIAKKLLDYRLKDA